MKGFPHSIDSIPHQINLNIFRICPVLLRCFFFTSHTELNTTFKRLFIDFQANHSILAVAIHLGVVPECTKGVPWPFVDWLPHCPFVCSGGSDVCRGGVDFDSVFVLFHWPIHQTVFQRSNIFSPGLYFITRDSSSSSFHEPKSR